MPACARSKIVIEGEIGVYHCIAKCVRGAFLCGKDPSTREDYNHRKDWLFDRMRELAQLFAIEVCGYSIMSNHFHIVLRTRPDLADQWSADEIALRWCKVFPHHDDATGKPVEPGEHDLAMITSHPEKLAERRKRLASLSWFMRCLCETIARKANAEDKTSGRFWAGRFKSVALLDEAAVLACSVYVDLNPIRAGLATTPEESLYTSGRDRIKGMLGSSSSSAVAEKPNSPETYEPPDAWLCELTIQESTNQPASTAPARAESIPQEPASPAGPIACATTHAADEIQRPADSGAIAEVSSAGESPRRLHARASDQGFLPISLEQYLMLLDWTGRQLRADKRGAIPDHLAPIMERLAVNQSNWVETVRRFGRMFKQAAGRSSAMIDAAASRSRHWFQGKAAAQAAFV